MEKSQVSIFLQEKNETIKTKTGSKYKGLLNCKDVLSISNNDRVELNFSSLECGLDLMTHFQTIECAKAEIGALLVEEPCRCHLNRGIKVDIPRDKSY